MEWNAYEAAMEALARMEKQSFIPMPAGQPPAPPMDPSMMGGGMPMDPSMMGGGMPMDPAMMGGGMPMDPAMMGGDPAAMGGMPPPPVDPAAEEQAAYDMIVQAVRQVLSEMGIAPEGGEEKPEGESKSKEEGKGEEKGNRIDELEKTVKEIAKTLGIGKGGGSEAATGMSSGSGMPDAGAGAMPMMGPLDPMGGAGMADAAAMSGMPMPAPTQMPKAGGLRPLDDRNWARNLAASLKRMRAE